MQIWNCQSRHVASSEVSWYAASSYVPKHYPGNAGPVSYTL